MEKPKLKKLLTLEEILANLVANHHLQDDWINSFLHDMETGLEKVRTLHAILKRMDHTTWRLISETKHHKSLKSLSHEELVSFYYGCTQTALIAGVIRSVYWGFKNSTGEKESEELTANLLYLRKAANIKVSLKEFKSTLLEFFTTSPKAKDFERVVRKCMPGYNNYEQRRSEGVFAVCQQMKDKKTSVDSLAFALLGIAFQTNWFRVKFTPELVKQATVDLKQLVTEVSTDTNFPTHVLRMQILINFQSTINTYKS